MGTSRLVLGTPSNDNSKNNDAQNEIMNKQVTSAI